MGQAFLYGNGSGGTGGTLVVTAPAGVTCTVSKDGKTKVKTVDQYGYATFKGLDTGTWTVTISDGSQTSTEWKVDVVADYAVTVSFFSATISVTYPEGAIVTCSDGQTTLTAPDTSGSHTFTVPNAGTWTLKYNDLVWEEIQITTYGENAVAWPGYLFYYGKQGHEWETGTVKLSSSNADSKRAPTVTVNDDGSVKVSQKKPSSGWYSGCYKTKDTLDFTNVNTLAAHIGALATYNGGCMIAVSPADATTIKEGAAVYTKVTNPNTVYNLDVSSVTGLHSVVLFVSANSGDSDCPSTSYAVLQEVEVLL